MNKKIRYYEIIFLLIVAAGITSCNKLQGNENKSNLQKEITITNADNFAQIINNRNGKILLINVWATWCIPCIEEFPDLIKLKHEYNKKDVDIITLNINLLSEKDSKVLLFLKKNGNIIPVLMAEDDNIDDLINLLDKNWSGEVPVTFVFNRKGKIFSSVLGKQDYNYFSSIVDSALTAQ